MLLYHVSTTNRISRWILHSDCNLWWPKLHPLHYKYVYYNCRCRLALMTFCFNNRRICNNSTSLTNISLMVIYKSYVYFRFGLGRNKITVGKRTSWVLERFMEYCRLHNERVLHSLDKFAFHFLVYCTGRLKYNIYKIVNNVINCRGVYENFWIQNNYSTIFVSLSL